MELILQLWRALLHRAIGDQLTCVFVDTGLLRKNEGDQVMQVFAEHLNVKVIRVNASDRFYAVLKGVSDPEEKENAQVSNLSGYLSSKLSC